MPFHLTERRNEELDMKYFTYFISSSFILPINGKMFEVMETQFKILDMFNRGGLI